MERRDTSLVVAMAVLGLVLVGVGAIAFVRIRHEGGFDALDNDREAVERDDCLELAKGLAYGGNPYEGEIGTRDDGSTETIDGVERGWSVHESTYRDAGAARSAFDTLELAQSPELKHCFLDDVEVLDFPGQVEDGYGTGEVTAEDGIREQVYYALWRDGDRIVGFTAYSLGNGDISAWVRERYEATRAKWD